MVRSLQKISQGLDLLFVMVYPKDPTKSKCTQQQW